jgi:hypothetical protein
MSVGNPHEKLTPEEMERLHRLGSTGLMVIDVPPEVREFLEGIRRDEVKSLGLLVSLGPKKIHVLTEWIDNRLFWAKSRKIAKYALLAFIGIVSTTALLLSHLQTISTVLKGGLGR